MRRFVPSSLHRCAPAAVLASASVRRCHAAEPAAATPGKIKVKIHSDVNKKTKDIVAPTGITLMEAIRDIAKLDMEAACDGTCACSTCHVIFTEASYKTLGEDPTEDELDMLDLAPKVSKTSRLSCQVKLAPEMDGMELTIPDEMENQMSAW
ncbi:ferredoxin 2fe-2S-like protein [Strigomonas culicis]|uniref:Ferredoxin 2fe-2S-like protein n=1 Tax=Strigomonas culicis TaxID=28005 RepID=S9V0I4_9TRYP|nr:ferredoxin 2fe-2S-like protein [Strigomonas culicis]|eukprot:EPY34519.1 ferredoxin 2fe-2S-like protein [Strigomonas culicis]